MLWDSIRTQTSTRHWLRGTSHNNAVQYQNKRHQVKKTTVDCKGQMTLIWLSTVWAIKISQWLCWFFPSVLVNNMLKKSPLPPHSQKHLLLIPWYSVLFPSAPVRYHWCRKSYMVFSLLYSNKKCSALSSWASPLLFPFPLWEPVFTNRCSFPLRFQLLANDILQHGFLSFKQALPLKRLKISFCPFPA